MDINALDKVSYGLYVICTHDNSGGFNGCVVNTFFQITSNPVKIAVSVSKNNYTHELIKNSKTFSCNVLRKDAELENYGKYGYRTGRDINKFDEGDYTVDINGNPILLGNVSCAFFVCWVTEIYDLGTHSIFVALVDDAAIIDKEADVLTYDYYKKEKKMKPPPNAPTYKPSH